MRLIACLAVAAAQVSCAPKLTRSVGNPDGDTLRPDSSFSPIHGGDGSAAAATDKNCGLQKYDLHRQPPEVLLVQDRSGSMLESTKPEGQRWAVVTSALDQVMMQTQMGILWGLKLYPMGDACGVPDGVDVPNAANNQAAISAAMHMWAPETFNRTPTALAIEAATAYMKARTTPNPRYLLLATDGIPLCLDSNDQTQDKAAALKAVTDAAALGLHTFVVGIATAGTTVHDHLNELAMRGLEPQAGAVQYYPAANRDELVAALQTVAGRVMNCTFPLTGDPPAPDFVAVNADNTRVERDRGHVEGWDYAADQKSIVFYGTLCDRVKTDAIEKVEIIFGCPGTLIP